jgi:hypothetical protein
MACAALAFTHKCGMADVDQLAKDLKAQLRLCEDILAIVETRFCKDEQEIDRGDLHRYPGDHFMSAHRT